jgi:hypothetical protein
MKTKTRYIIRNTITGEVKTVYTAEIPPSWELLKQERYLSI